MPKTIRDCVRDFEAMRTISIRDQNCRLDTPPLPRVDIACPKYYLVRLSDTVLYAALIFVSYHIFTNTINNIFVPEDGAMSSRWSVSKESLHLLVDRQISRWGGHLKEFHLQRLELAPT